MPCAFNPVTYGAIPLADPVVVATLSNADVALTYTVDVAAVLGISVTVIVAGGAARATRTRVANVVARTAIFLKLAVILSRTAAIMN